MKRLLWTWRGAAGALVVLFVAITYRLLTGLAIFQWDADDFFAPYYILVADHARAGRLLLWNPWSNGGSPDFADPQVGAFSPVVILFGALTGGTSSGFRLYWLAIWFLAAAGMLLLARHLKAPPWGGLVVALGFAFSGFFVGHAEHTSFVHSLAWLPFIVWRLDVALSSRQTRPALEAGALWGLSALAGYPGLALLNALFACLWVAGRWSWPCGPDSRDGAPVPIAVFARTTAILLVVGVVVMAPSYAGLSVEGRGFSDRVNPLTRERAIGSNALHPRALATFFSPFIGSPESRAAWSYTDPSSASLYVGAGVVWLAILALVARPRQRWRWWLVAMVLLAIAMSLGNTVPLRGWLYDLVPPFRYFRHAAMIRGYAIFYLAVLALIGAREFSDGGALQGRWSWRLVLGTAVLALIAIGTAYGVLLVPAGASDPHRLTAVAHVATVWLGILSIGVACRVLRGRTRAWVLPGALILIAIVDGFASERLTYTIEYSRTGAIDDWRHLDAAHDGSLDLAANGIARIPAFEDVMGSWVSDRNLPGKVPVLRAYAPFNNRFHAQWLQYRSLWEAATGDDRWWFSTQMAIVAPSDAAMAAFARRSESLGAPPLVIHTIAELTGGHGAGESTATDAADVAAITMLPAAQRLPIALTTYRPDELTFEVTAPASGWLMITDRWAKGWRATVNGNRVQVLPAGFIFRAIPIRPGTSTVRFTYHPFGFPWLVALSWTVLALTAIWGITTILGVKRSRNDRSAATPCSSGPSR